MKQPIVISISYGNDSWNTCAVPLDPKAGADVVRKLQVFALKRLDAIETEQYVPEEQEVPAPQ